METLLPKSGHYVVAVSGGVDSVSLLDLMSRAPGLSLTVAHFDHGIREDSAEDRRLVQNLAANYKLPFVYDEGRLGAGASEAEARTARYAFLNKVRRGSAARAVATAHHQDDLLETAILNLLRGTGRKGLTALKNRPRLVRPLLGATKQQLVDYARANGLKWREDPTNVNPAYLRNYVRQRLLPRFGPADKTKLVDLITRLAATNEELDAALAEALGSHAGADLDRQWFGQLPHAVAKEVLAAWLRAHGIADFDRRTLERLVVAAKVGAAGKTFPIKAGFHLRITADRLALT